MSIKNITKQNFISDTLGRMRLAWSHECHKWFEEVCIIYFLRTTIPYAKSLENIESHLESTCFCSYSVYPLYGPNDFVVIGWGHTQKHELLQDVLRADSSLRIAKLFEVQHVIQGEFHRSVIPADGTQWSREIEKFYRAEHGVLEAEKFCSTGLILTLDEIAEPVFKFFVVLEPTVPNGKSDRTRPVNLVTLLDPLRDIVARDPEIRMTFYEGKDDGYVIEATARSYNLVFETLQVLAKTWTHGQLRPETSLVSSQKVIECDEIDTDWAPLTSSERKLIDFLDMPKAVTSFLALTQEERAQVVSIYRKYVLDLADSPSIRSPFQGAFRDLLNARVFGKSRYLVSALPVVHELEGYLSLVMKKTWMQELGDDWVKLVTKEGKEIDEKFNVRSFGLAVAIHVSNKIPVIQKSLNERLGNDWLSRIEGVRECRNRFAHGEIAIDESYLNEKWHELVVSVLEVGLIFNRVVALYEEMTDNKYTAK